MDMEKFSSVPLAPIRANYNEYVVWINMGVLRNKLCAINAYDLFFYVWESIMKDDDDDIGKSYNCMVEVCEGLVRYALLISKFVIQ